MNTVFIAEKPSLAEAIAMALGEKLGEKPKKEDGRWVVGKNEVTWFFGHMYQQAEPEAYREEWKRWSLESLPIILEENEWKIVPSKDKMAQLNKVKAMVKNAGIIVNCGDSGREGQLLVDEALAAMGENPFSVKVLRLWVQSMARRDMINALENTKPNARYMGLYDAAVCRQRADWQHGMSFSRLYTLLARRGGSSVVLSVGRVQTPTLRLVVDRDLERENFQPVAHFQVRRQFQHANGKFWASWVFPDTLEALDSDGRLLDEEIAKQEAKQHGATASVVSFSSEKKSKAPPLPHSLSSLQAEAGKKFGLTAKQVLDVAQSLYETHRAITYPRTDSRYLPENIFKDEAPAIIAALLHTDEFAEAARAANAKTKSAAWNNAKISDHHGMIPTVEFSSKKLERMSPIERRVFSLIARSFLAQFMNNFQYLALKAEILYGESRYLARGAETVDLGWKKAFLAASENTTTDNDTENNGDDESEDESGQTLPRMTKGDNVQPLGNGEVLSRTTSPPPAFTDPLLISAMANIHRFVSSPEIKKRLKESSGIGTEATRAECIETLLRRGLLVRKGKNGLESSATGRSLIAALPEQLKSPGLTALWEEGLKKVEQGELPKHEFLAAQSASITKQVAETIKTTPSIRIGENIPAPLPGDGKKCQCGGVMTTKSIKAKTGKIYVVLSCSNYPECREVEWPKGNTEVAPLEGDGTTCNKCKKGIMKTFVVKKSGENYGKKFLSCTERDCLNFAFPATKVMAEKSWSGWETPSKRHDEKASPSRKVPKQGKAPTKKKPRRRNRQ